MAVGKNPPRKPCRDETAWESLNFPLKPGEAPSPQYTAAWMRDMFAWSCNLRDDLVRLEGRVGLATGDPGDPPPPPPPPPPK